MSDMAGACRTQRLLWPDLLDDDGTEEKPVRFMAADGASLELVRPGFARAQAASPGRPADDPRDLLTLSLSGYRHRLRSSRSWRTITAGGPRLGRPAPRRVPPLEHRV